MTISDNEIKRALNSIYGVTAYGMNVYTDTDNISVKNTFNINDIAYYYNDKTIKIEKKRIVSIQLQPDGAIIYNYTIRGEKLFLSYEDAMNYAIKRLKDSLNATIEDLKKGANNG